MHGKTALLVATLALAACSKLTEPPTNEAISGEPAGSAEPKQAKPANENPDNKQGAREGHQNIADALNANAKPAEAAPPPTNEKLETKDLVVGKGATAKAGDTVKVHYVGTLADGKEFDSSKKHGQPFEFELGAGRVIKGWDQGVAGMKVGGKRKLTVPPSLGYGPRGFPPVIPPNATLVFDVELLEVKGKK